MSPVEAIIIPHFSQLIFTQKTQKTHAPHLKKITLDFYRNDKLLLS